MASSGHLIGQKAANGNVRFDCLEHRVHYGNVRDIRHQWGTGGQRFPGVLGIALMVMELQSQHQIPGPLVEGSLRGLTQPNHIRQIGNLQATEGRRATAGYYGVNCFHDDADTGMATVYKSGTTTKSFP